MDTATGGEPERVMAMSRYGAWGLVGLLLVVLTALYGRVATDLVWQWWDDPNYSHGFLVPVFSVFLVWQRRRELARTPRASTWLGSPVLLAGLGMLTLGEVGAEFFLSRSSLIVVLAGLTLLLLGRAVLRRMAFPLAYLLFMVPLPSTVFYAITFPLQRLASSNAADLLDLLGVPVLLDGNVIQLSQITLGVTEACSGIRSLISLLALGVAWAALMPMGLWARLIMVTAAVPITIAANAARVVATGLIGQSFGIEYAQGFYHTFSGWIIFIVAVIGLVGVQGALRAGAALRRWHPA